MEIETYRNYHLVKSEDLNHHGTLYAGRTAEWFVEAGFIAASSLTSPDNIVCLQVHGMLFKSPIKKGEVACFESKIIYTGRTKLVAYIRIIIKEQPVVDGFITFIHVDENGKSLPHGIVLEPTDPEDISLQKRAEALFPKRK